MLMYFLRDTRYYCIETCKNLFDEYCVEIFYGSIKNKSHTGQRKYTYSDEVDMKRKVHKLTLLRLSHGYNIVNQ